MNYYPGRHLLVCICWFYIRYNNIFGADQPKKLVFSVNKTISYWRERGVSVHSLPQVVKRLFDAYSTMTKTESMGDPRNCMNTWIKTQVWMCPAVVHTFRSLIVAGIYIWQTQLRSIVRVRETKFYYEQQEIIVYYVKCNDNNGLCTNNEKAIRRDE